MARPRLTPSNTHTINQPDRPGLEPGRFFAFETVAVGHRGRLVTAQPNGRSRKAASSRSSRLRFVAMADPAAMFTVVADPGTEAVVQEARAKLGRVAEGLT